MITAERARKLVTNGNIDRQMANIYVAIEQRAIDGYTFLRAGIEYRQDIGLWVNEGLANSEQWIIAKNLLVLNGFEVSFTRWNPDCGQSPYQPASVDFHTLITW